MSVIANEFVVEKDPETVPSDKKSNVKLSTGNIYENTVLSNLSNNINKLTELKKRLSFLLREIDLCINRS